MIIKDHNNYAIHIHFADIKFQCPKCKKKYYDYEGKYLKRINKNKSMITRIKCNCGYRFLIALDYKGTYQTF